ncbi:hypothetical protein Tco_1427943 [Tanacetum coccineum]
MWKWERYNNGFFPLQRLSQNLNQHDAIWVIVDRLTKSAHFIPIRATDSMETLTSIPSKNILSTWRTNLYHLWIVTVISHPDSGNHCKMLWPSGRHKLELPEELSSIHNTFHVSNLKKCLSDESLIIPMKELQLNDKLNFVEEPVEIMDHEIKQLKRSRIPIVKVRWNSKRGP